MKNFRFRHTVIFAILVSVLFISPGFAQVGSSINGFVFDSERRPIPRVRIELMDELGRVLHRVVSDGSGRYTFRGLSSGRFAVKVLPLGTSYDAQTKDVEIAGVGVTGRSLADNVQLDFYLQMDRRKENAVNEVIFAQDVPSAAKEAYKKAVENIDNDKLSTGIAGLSESLKLFPTYFAALEKLGLAYNKEQKFEDALEIFSRAIVVNDKSFTCWYGSGYANYALGRWDAAVENILKATALNSNSMEAQLLLGISQRQVRQYKEAEVSLVKAKELSGGKVADIHWNLALLYAHNLKRYKDASKELELYLKADPEIPNKDAIKKLIADFKNKK